MSQVQPGSSAALLETLHSHVQAVGHGMLTRSAHRPSSTEAAARLKFPCFAEGSMMPSPAQPAGRASLGQLHRLWKVSWDWATEGAVAPGRAARKPLRGGGAGWWCPVFPALRKLLICLCS